MPPLVKACSTFTITVNMFKSRRSTRSRKGTRIERPPRTKRYPTLLSPTWRVEPQKINTSLGVATYNSFFTSE
jgi:hypothetical protein